MSRSSNVFRVAVIGAGNRGMHLSKQLLEVDPGIEIHAVADPDEKNRSLMAGQFGIDATRIFSDWHNLFDHPTDCHAAIVATKDHLHTGPVLEALKRGWHVLLEKPMAHTHDDTISIRDAWKRSGRIVSVCHSLRYRSDFNRVKSLVDQGAIGEIKSIEHREGIDPVRFSHNYVRGKWAREEDNTFLLLHKSSHDLDFIAWLVDRPCHRVSSFGGRSFFHPSHAPEHAGTRCLVDCPIEDTCFFSARRIYLSKPPDQWPVIDVVTTEFAKDLEGELAKGPFGRCVWRHSNDVVDHQMVNFEFDRGCYAQFSLVGLSHRDGRYTHIFGTEGNLIFDEAAQHIMLSRFGAAPEEISLQNPGGYHPEDRLIVQGWLNAIHSGDLSGLMVDPEEALRTHTLAFAAERSRKQNRIVDINEFD